VPKREGLLKLEFKDWYPTLVAGVWYRADWLTDTVLQQLRLGEPRWQPEDRVPCDQHCVFRGGRSDRRRGTWTRRTDEGRRSKSAPGLS
jgi:hypothetical protein